MAMPNRNGLEMVHLNCHSLDITTSGVDRCYSAVYAPVRGKLVRVKAAAYTDVSGTASAVVVKIGTVTVSGATLSFVSGIAAGACYSASTTNSPLVQQGDIISFNSDGAGANETAACTFQVSLRRV